MVSGLPLSVRIACTVKQLAPRPLRRRVKDWLRQSSWVGTQFQCPVCEAGLSRFEPLPAYYFSEWQRHQYVHSIFAEETLNIEQFACPCCGAMDRERLIALYCRSRHCGLEIEPARRVLEIAPTPALSAFLRRLPICYQSADLSNARADDCVDITDMHRYRDASFDMFVCSHVLEHVSDDGRALDELFRILTPSGSGIVMVPINLALQATHEDSELTTEAERWRAFGQHDHVRVYSKNGFLARLRGAGFAVHELGVEHFGEPAFRDHGIHPRSVLYVAEKPG